MQVQADEPSLSRWLLATEQFGRSWEFSWLARNLTPIRFQKVRRGRPWRPAPAEALESFRPGRPPCHEFSAPPLPRIATPSRCDAVPLSNVECV